MWGTTWNVTGEYLCEKKLGHFYVREDMNFDSCVFMWEKTWSVVTGYFCRKKTWSMITVHLCEGMHEFCDCCVYMWNKTWSDCYVLMRKEIWSVIVLSWSDEIILDVIFVCAIAMDRSHMSSLCNMMQQDDESLTNCWESKLLRSLHISYWRKCRYLKILFLSTAVWR